MGRTEAERFQWDERSVPTSEIDTTDDTCQLGLSVDSRSLVHSIQSLNLINPPILRPRKDQKYQIVCGFRRVSACKALGWNEIPSRVLNQDLTDFEVLRLAVMDNRSHRRLSIVEQARGVQRLSPHVAANRRLKSLSSLLGFPCNKKVLAKLTALSRLPEAIQHGVLEETISFEAAVLLAELSEGDARSCFEALASLKLSQNKQKEIILWAREIAMREDISVTEVLKSLEIRRILEHSDLNRNEKGSGLRAYLKKRRFPMLARAEEKSREHTKALKLDGDMHITPPPSFEGGNYTLRMTFKSLADFNARLKDLKEMAKNPALKRLLKPFD